MVEIYHPLSFSDFTSIRGEETDVMRSAGRVFASKLSAMGAIFPEFRKIKRQNFVLDLSDPSSAVVLRRT